MGKQNIQYAPVVLFLYNRPKHTKITLDALKANPLASNTDLYIFIDGPKTLEQRKNVEEVYNIASNTAGFRKIKIVRSHINKGLSNSVINGVTDIINQYGKVIVLEDDLISSSYFLEYMNNSLNLYENNTKIWSISGYTPRNINSKGEYDKDIYLSVRGCSWGWGTWKNRWELIDWEVKDYVNSKNKQKIRREFNKGGNDLSFMLEDQINGRIDSWAIRWVYNQFKHSSYTVYPIKSMITNIGLDFSGTHSSNNQKYYSPLFNERIELKPDIQLNDILLKEFKSFYDLTLKGYLGVFLRRIGIYKQIRKIQKKFSR